MNRKSLFNIMMGLSGLLLMVLISVLLSFFLSNVFGNPLTILLKSAISNSIFLGGVVLLTLYIANILALKIRNGLLIFLSLSMIVGAGVLFIIVQIVLSPLTFMYMDSRTVVYLFVNLLFYVAINLVATGAVIFQKTITAKESALNTEKYLKKQIEIKLLTSKLNPHFLFNSLNLIVSLLKEPDKAEEALLNLSDLLRYNLDTTDQEWTGIDDEISYIRKYLSIQKTRFEDRLDYEIQQEATGKIPPFIIQPLVENCVKHNLNEVEHLTIWIRVLKNGRKNKISIVDSQRLVGSEMLYRGQGLTITKNRVEAMGGLFLFNEGGIDLVFDA